MGLVAGVAGNASGVIGGCNLGEGFGLGAVGLVAAGAYDGGVELRRFHGGGIVGVPGLGSVAGFARDDDMLAQLFLSDDIGVTSFADIVARKGHGAGGGLCDGCAAIVSVLAEAFGDDKGAQDDKGNQGDGDDDREPDEMFNILEQGCAPNRGRELRGKLRAAHG